MLTKLGISELDEYIVRNVKKGVRAEHIIVELVNKGWSDSLITAYAISHYR